MPATRFDKFLGWVLVKLGIVKPVKYTPCPYYNYLQVPENKIRAEKLIGSKI